MSTWLDTNSPQPQVYTQTTSTDSATTSSATSNPAVERGDADYELGEANLETAGDKFAQNEAKRDRQFAQLFDQGQNTQSSGSGQDYHGSHEGKAVNGLIAKAGPGAAVTVPAPALVNKLVSVGATQTPEFGNLKNYVYAQSRPGSGGVDKATAFGLAGSAYGAVQSKMVSGQQQGGPITRAGNGTGNNGNNVQNPSTLYETQTGGAPYGQGSQYILPGQQGGQGVGNGYNGYTADNVPTSSSSSTLNANGSNGSTGVNTFSSGSDDAWLNSSGPNALVYMVMVLALQEDNKDKAVFLNQINKFNIIGQQMGQYLSNVLEPAQVQLNKQQNACGNNSTDRDSQQVTVQEQTGWDYELYQNANTGSVETGYQVRDQKVDSQGLSAMLKEFDQDQETLNNKRDQASNSFQAADQTSQQSFNMLSSFVKAENDASNSVIRNIAS